MPPIPRLEPYRGPALFSYGFRPFFLFGAIYAGLAVVIWLPVFCGELALPTAFSPRDWHVHEMLYGYVSAVVTGFLLTAIPNWTGRLPLQGAPLMVLLIAWAAGRVAVTLSGTIGWLPAAVIDGGFLLLVGAAAAREIMASGNWGNLKVVALIGLLAAGNVAFHLEAHFEGAADYSVRIGMAAVIMLITLIGGRIVPSLTRNWLARENPGRLPAPFGRFDAVVIAASALALLLWIVLPQMHATGAALLIAGLLQLARLARWAGDRTTRERLVLILHVGYAFVPFGFLLVGLATFDVVPAAAGVHAFAGGAIGTMTLAVMTRASLGHTGRTLTAARATQAIYLAILLAAFARIGAALAPAWLIPLLAVSAIFWVAAFFGFGAAYGKLLVARPSA
ncbi:NnrS family protein [Rhodoplanes sp. Z2-YC6860]|uniref:NnrS family protein n=1 Tax=Rhodoplanes sp. Z2-YC6860 TaxID=674703 RepID=UPI00082B722D|nr:NnrS family protein [Rhodoplanes sp. Z2-YC6860]